MPLAANLDGVDICADECADVEEAVVAYPQPKFASSSESFHVTDCAKRNSAEAAGASTPMLASPGMHPMERSY
jgi:hypothetical protein